MKTSIIFALMISLVAALASVEEADAAKKLKKPWSLNLIPQDHAMVLDWKKPYNSKIPDDYVVKYKGNWERSWKTFSDGASTSTEATVTGLSNGMTYEFKVASKKGSETSSYTAVKRAAPTSNCSQTGIDGTAQRCYATQQYSFNSNNVNGIKGKINFDDTNLTSGFIQASYWLKLADRKVLEVGIYDQSSGSMKFNCAYNGNMENKRFSSTPADDVDYGFKIEKRGSSWVLSSNGETCKTVRSSYAGLLLDRGSETSRNNTPDFINEFKDVKLKQGRAWSLLSSSHGSDSRSGMAYGFFVDNCGSGSQQYYHIETGKGASRNC